jgi:RimJ/RimL family protein N-acetyltransferase
MGLGIGDRVKSGQIKMSKRTDFPAFLEAMHGRCLLHVGHKDADCDALGSAYAMSRLLPGDVGFAQGIKASARDLAEWLELTPVIDPNPAAYEYTILYDINSLTLLGLPLPPRYALFDHHVPGGHRYSNFHSQLADRAEWCWVRPVESTCSVLADLFLAHNVPLNRKMEIALAAGIVTDTVWLQLANAAALRRLAAVLEPSSLYLEDVLTVIDNPNRRASRRAAVLAAVRGVQETLAGGWSILAAETDSHDHGFAVIATLSRLGGDVRAVSFPKGEKAMVMIECDEIVAERGGIDLADLAAEIAQTANTDETWGSRIWGRVIAPMSQRALLDRCVKAVAQTLTTVKEDTVEGAAALPSILEGTGACDPARRRRVEETRDRPIQNDAFHPMDETSARAVLSWRYEEPYTLYNTDPDEVEENVQALLDPRNAYYTLTNEEGEIEAYCCFGPDARVPGGDYSLEALDLGMSVRPDLTGQGRGHTYVSALLNFARRTFAPAAFRVTVAKFNKRALRVWEKAGFRPMQTFRRERDGMAFVVLVREDK